MLSSFSPNGLDQHLISAQIVRHVGLKAKRTVYQGDVNNKTLSMVCTQLLSQDSIEEHQSECMSQNGVNWCSFVDELCN